jgi:hypothetical protein
VRSGGGKWIRGLDLCFALGAPGVGVRAMNFSGSSFHEGDRGPLLSGNRK